IPGSTVAPARPTVLPGMRLAGLRPGTGRLPSSQAIRAAHECAACAPHRSRHRSRTVATRPAADLTDCTHAG
ncbi:hypothetical protein, partial [Micromonospora globispora]|uniref:hypothetical protein n=1 Tax=Micromonospora globispora TaxID=1450148 RepID=UPI000F95AC89